MREENFVLHASSEQFYWEGSGQLSIKTFSKGAAYYKTTKGYFAVEDNRYLLLNEGNYTISIDDTSKIESFCLFFKGGFAEDIARCMEDSTDNLLTDPYRPLPSMGFFERTYATDKILSCQLDYFKSHLSTMKNDLLWKEEQFHKVMQLILFTHQQTQTEMSSLKSLRHSTREELYRRVTIAHDYIRAFYRNPIDLQEISQIACLSPNHLLRNYSLVYRKTPHQHITELRFSKAKQLLESSNLSITDIAFEIGFDTPSSFSKMFKKIIGSSPLQYRKKVILDKSFTT